MFSGIFRPMHLLVILLVVLIIFGPGKIADLGGALGKAIKGFKKEISGSDEERKQI
jgi:sec-independent protein translocase protein TatA